MLACDSISMGPGCVRGNSDGIIRDLLFMHIEHGQMGLVVDMLDTETMDLKTQSGQTIDTALDAVKHKFNVKPVFQKLDELKKQKAQQPPQSDESD